MNEYIFGSLITLEAQFDPSATDAKLRVRSPGQTIPTEYTLTGTAGLFTKDIDGDLPGVWWYRFEVIGIPEGEVEDSLLVLEDQTDALPVTDDADLRVFIPRARRAINGPGADAPVDLTDTEVLGLIADSLGTMILLTSGLIGHELVVTARDPFYRAPVAWKTDTPLDQAAETAMIAQVGVDFYFNRLRDMVTSETIMDEGQSWSYERPAAVIRDQLKLLASIRDRAVETIIADHPPAEAWVDFVHERDQFAAAFLEPFGSQHNQGMGGQFMDPRGFF